MSPRERAAALLLVLMNEHLPAGVVRDVVLRARAIDDRDFEAHAELAALAYREAHYLLDGTSPDEEPEPEPEEEPAALQALDESKFMAHRQLAPLGGDVLDEAMVDWLDLFDDRISSDVHFAAAVNEAVDAGREATEETAQLVAERVREMAAASERGAD